MEKVGKRSRSFEEAEEWDIEQQVSMTPQERMKAAKAIKDRLFPPPQPDVRECHKKK